MNHRRTDRKVFHRCLAHLLLSLLVIASLAPLAVAEELVILYSNDIRGEIDPCG